MQRLLTLPLILLIASCSSDAQSVDQEPEPEDSPVFSEVTETHLPGTLTGASMDAHPADVDSDGDLDLIVACEFCSNILLINDGEGRFTDESAERLPRTRHDSEDVGVADFDGDGDIDAVVVTEDDLTNELYLNDGSGDFEAGGDRLPVEGRSNAVVVAELTGDGHPDILIGNNGQNHFLVNDGSGSFVNETDRRLPRILDVTQDLELGDVDGDGDLDLLVGNEDLNRLLINDGSGVFSDQTADRLEERDGAEETREADFGDVDGDGDLDIAFGNVVAFVQNSDPRNRLLINDGSGVFTDETASRLPDDRFRSFDIDFIDIDGDDDLDIVSSDAAAGQVFTEPVHAYINNGLGVFERADREQFPGNLTGKWFDAEPADFNGDGAIDIYFASQRSRDRLIISNP